MFILTNQLHFSTVHTWDALNVNVKGTRVLMTNTVKCSNHEFTLPQPKKLPGRRNLAQRRSRGPTKKELETCSRTNVKFLPPPHTIHKLKQSRRLINALDNVEFISSKVHSSRQEALLFFFEDNEAVIKMIIKGRSPTMRHFSRIHRVALDWLLDRINFYPKIQMNCVDTKNPSRRFANPSTNHA